MGNPIDFYEAETQLSQLLSRVELGEEIVIARNGMPVARFVPMAVLPKRTPGRFKGQFVIANDFEDFTAQDDRDWYGA